MKGDVNRMKWVITIALLVGVVGGVVGLGCWRFHAQVRQETNELLARNKVLTHIVEEEMMDHLPDPIKRWLHNAGVIGKEMVHTVHLHQKGIIRLEPDQKQWMEADSQQLFTVETPGFIWNVRTSMGGLPVLGRDLLSHGQGSMEIRLAGLVPVVDVSHHEHINEATLQRFLGEIVWFPSAALRPYIQWEPVDDYSARATMTHGGSSGSAVFHFNEKGEVTHVVAQRYKDVNDESPTEWVATVKETSLVNDISIPTQLEIAWVLDGTPFTWYVLEINEVIYNQVSY